MVTSTPIEQLLDCPRVQRWFSQDKNFAAKIEWVRNALSLATDEIIQIVTAAIASDEVQIEKTLADKTLSSEMQGYIFELKDICRQLEESRKAAVVTRLYPTGNEDGPDCFVTAFCSELSSISSTNDGGWRISE